MPNGKHLEATEEEKESSLICSLIKYVYGYIGHKEVPAWVVEVARDYYGSSGRLEEAKKMLVECLRGFVDLETLVYNAHSKESRRLADWWEEYQRQEGEKCAEKKTNK